jgi:uncharacterized protein (TIGR03437 family)
MSYDPTILRQFRAALLLALLLFPALIHAQTACPAFSYNSSPLAAAQTFLGWGSGGPNPNGIFSMYGSGIYVAGPAYPRYSFAVGGITDTSEDLGSTAFSTSFYHSGSSADLIFYGGGESASVYVNDQFCGVFSGALATGTAQSGGANTITLAAGSSSINGFYNQWTISITGGTGVGQARQISGYVATTLVATLSSPWGTSPDSTSTYAITGNPSGIYVDGSNGSLKYLNMQWSAVATRKVTVITGIFAGINIGPKDKAWPAPPLQTTRAIVVGDSFIEGAGGPFNVDNEVNELGYDAGWQVWSDGEGSTGWVATVDPISGYLRLNFMDRIAPPPESWALQILGASGGTFDLKVTYGGSTQTASSIAYNSTPGVVQAALQTLTNLPANSVTVGGGFDYGRPLFILLHNAPGATLSWTNNTTGTTSSSLTPWTGSVAPRVPRDSNGNAEPFVLYVQGSGNDVGGQYPVAQVQANATYTAQQIKIRFPTAVAIFSGVVAVSTNGGAGIISATDISYNTAIKTAASFLNPITSTSGQSVPFIDTYSAGIGNCAWICGGGSVANPTAGKNDILISITAPGHPTGNGHAYLATKIAQNINVVLNPGYLPQFTSATVVNAASYAGGGVSPGEIITIFGQNLGPSSLVAGTFDATGELSVQAAGTEVLFDGVRAPLIYATSGQLSAIVPYEISGASTQVQVQNNGQWSSAVGVNVVDAAPGIFTLPQSSQAAALNADLSVNGLSNPAPKGSIIVLFATGEGQTSPAGVDGKVAANTYPTPILPVSITIGGSSATLLYGGAAPAEVAGVLQLNVQIPPGTPSGVVPVILKVGTHQSPSATIVVQ